MVQYNYETTSDLFPDTKLQVTETVDDRHTKFYYRGFKTINEAQQFATQWESAWGFGYSGVAYATEEVAEGAVVRASRYNSCD